MRSYLVFPAFVFLASAVPASPQQIIVPLNRYGQLLYCRSGQSEFINLNGKSFKVCRNAEKEAKEMVGVLGILAKSGVVKPGIARRDEESYHRGLRYEESGDLLNALKYYNISASTGVEFAQYKLGTFYDFGLLVEKDKKKAFDLYVQSSEKGCLAAKFQIANMYQYGDYLEKSLDKARELYFEIATAGSYRVNFDESAEVKNSQNILSRQYFETGEILDENISPLQRTLLTRWYRLLADSGDSTAQINVAKSFDGGVNFGKNPANDMWAELYYGMAAKQGNLEAKARLDYLKNPVSRYLSGDSKANSKVIRDALGLSVIPLDPQVALTLGLTNDVQGVVIDVPGSGTAGQFGLRRGDVIVSANNKSVTTAGALAAAIKEAQADGRSGIVLGVRRDGAATKYVSLRLAD